MKQILTIKFLDIDGWNHMKQMFYLPFIHTFLSMINIIKRYAETDVRIHFKADFDYNVHQADPFRTVLTF